MEDGGPTASIIFIVLILLDALFYGFGAAIQCLNEKEIEKEKNGVRSKKSERLLQIIKNPYRYINTVQLVVTIINIVMGGFYLGVWQKHTHNIWLASIILIYILLTFGVLIPKRIAIKYSRKWAYAFITPIYYITLMLFPLTECISLTAKILLRILGIKDRDSAQDVTEEEIISMVNEGHEQGVFLASEAEMISNIFEYCDKEAKDIMTHRKNIIAIDQETHLLEAINLMLEEKNSRYPVYEDNLDHIKGILHLKDAMRFHAKADILGCSIKDIEGLVRKAVFIPETRNIDLLFKTMQSMKIQMVIVVDEYGQTSGLVAMEDILEEIVGNILDEYDEDEEHIEEKGENEFIIEGMTPLEELEERFVIDFEEDEFDTLNGFLISQMDRIPEENEDFSVDVCGYNFKVLTVENKMIHTVLVKKIEEIENIEEEQEN